MKRLIWIILLLFNVQLIVAQYTEIINSKRPGLSESPYSLGTNVYQLETGLFLIDNDGGNTNNNTTSVGGELFLRAGLLKERLEFNINLAFQNTKFSYSSGNSLNVSGLSDMTIGAKYLIHLQKYTDKSKEIRSWKRKMAFDKKRIIPSIGVYAGVHPNFLGDNFKKDKLSFKGAVLLQNDLSDRFVILTNLIADYIGSENKFYSYIVTATYALNSNWSIFGENVGKFQKISSPKFQFGGGLAYLFSKDLQVDTSIRAQFLGDYKEYFASLGLSYRIDRHKDKVIQKAKSKSKGSGKKTKKKGFFSRLFGKKQKLKK